MPGSAGQPSFCNTCGMSGIVGAEFHPHALCLLVKARNGDTNKARSDLAFIIESARSNESSTKAMVDRFLRQVNRDVR